MDGDGVSAPGLERRVGVCLRGAAHVATFGVEDHGAILGQRGHRLVEQPAGLPPPSLVERQVELVGRHRVADGVDDGPHEPRDTSRRPFDRWGEQVGFGIEAEADGAVQKTPTLPAAANGEEKKAPTLPSTASGAGKDARSVEVTEGAELLAKAKGIDLATIKGSGPGGSIRRRDVAEAVERQQ